MTALATLLSIDAVSARAGCGLKPELRRAIEARLHPKTRRRADAPATPSPDQKEPDARAET